MIIPENIRKCVAFLGARRTDGEFVFAGSAFWIGRDPDNAPEGGMLKSPSVYLATARHVIDAVLRLGATDIYLRANLKDGSAAWIKSSIDDWYVHPTDSTIDIAILKTGIPSEWDHLVIPYSLCITDELIAKHGIDLGDEVFITGLFRHYHGTRHNIPIVRVGNLASMSEDPVQTKSFGLMTAFLIECRSIGGLSGSPVFVNLGITRLIEGQVKHAAGGQPIFFLIGAIHGHYDVDASQIDDGNVDADDLIGGGKVNTGIAIVTPLHRIREVIAAFENRS